VSCVITGEKRPSQAMVNARAAEMPAFSDEVMGKVRGIYEALIKQQVHHLW